MPNVSLRWFAERIRPNHKRYEKKWPTPGRESATSRLACECLGLAENARDLSPARGADTFGETAAIGLLDRAGELPLLLALHAVRLAGV